jgi:plastocyanin
VVAVAAITAAGLFGACGASDGGAGRDEASALSANAVTMQLIAFKPETLTVAPGATVTWTQSDPGVHTVTSGAVEQGGGGVSTVPDGRFDSGELATGETFTFTFDQPGTYSYFCAVHPATMRGEVRVS